MNFYYHFVIKYILVLFLGELFLYLNKRLIIFIYHLIHHENVPILLLLFNIFQINKLI